MKPVRLLAAFAFIFVIMSSVASVHAQTEVFTYEDGVRSQAFAGGRAVFFGDTSLNMENEQGGGWQSGKTYQVNWTLTLESLTPGYLNGTDFYIVVSWPPLESITPTIPAKAIVNQTTLSLEHKMGTISAAFTPTNTSNGFYMNPDFPFTVYVNGEPSIEDWASGVWHGGVGVSGGTIDNGTTEQPTGPTQDTKPEFPTLTVTAIAAIAALLGTLGVIAKKRKPTIVNQ
jgi:hypothetical protein